MSEHKENNNKALETRLSAFLQAVIDEAARNEPFGRKIEEIILGDSVKVIQTEKTHRKQKTVFNIVGYLHDNGKESLRKELSSKADSELRVILRVEKIKKGKSLKTIERDQMIEEIIQTASTRLEQGLGVSGISQK